MKVNNKKIIIVDDKELDIELAVEAFKELNINNQIITFTDGTEALKYFENMKKYLATENEIILVILDIKMPKISGLEILEELKKNEIFKAIPIIMLTSSKEENDLIQAYKSGANAYVTKPIDYSEFIEKITSIANFWIYTNEFIPRTMK